MSESTLKTLHQIQEADLEILSLDQQLDGLYGSMRELNDKIEALTIVHDRIKLNIKDTSAKLNLREVSFKDQQDSVESLRGHLKESKDLKEYHGLNAQIASKLNEMKQAEDEVLQGFEVVDKMKEELEGYATKIKELQDEIKSSEASISSEVSDLSSAIAKHQKKRDVVAKVVNKELLSEYERLFKHFEGEAICGVDDKTCDGCFMSLTANIMVLIVKAEEIIRCPSCGRLLYNSEKLE